MHPVFVRNPRARLLRCLRFGAGDTLPEDVVWLTGRLMMFSITQRQRCS